MLKPQDLIEHSLILVKTDGVQRGLVGEIISRFEKTGLKLVAMKLLTPSRELAEKHYPTTREEFLVGIGKKTLENYQEVGINAKEQMGTEDPKEIGLIVRKWLIDYLTAGPVVAMVWEGPLAVSLIRKICGHTLPLKADPGTIRGDFAFDSSALANLQNRAIKNMLHTSGSKEEADYEIPLWFSKDEIVTYKRVDEKIMLEY
jgi:nucleoside-diphosphate kinase